MAQGLTFDHRCGPDILTIVFSNDCFTLSLTLNELGALFGICRRAGPILNSKLTRFRRWCRGNGLYRPDKPLPDLILPSDMIAISRRFGDQAVDDHSWLAALTDQADIVASLFLARFLLLKIDRRAECEDEPDDAYDDSDSDDAASESSTPSSQNGRILSLLEKAAGAGHPMVHLSLAKCYLTGHGADQDHAKAIGLLHECANRGIAQASASLAQCYENGEGVKQDLTTAIEWYTKAASQGDKSARLGATFLGGWVSFIGHGVEQSDADAFSHWQEVSDKSTDRITKPIATHMVGWMLYLGRGTQQDKQRGILIIRENQSPEFSLGDGKCFGGYNAPGSHSPAARKFFKLCQLGSERDWLCKHLTALCLNCKFGIEYGKEGTSDTAVSIFEQLANERHSDSQFWTGCCYFYYRGVPRSYSKAFYWFSKAADQDNSYGQWMVGACYGNGWGVTKDETKAAEWYRKSAEQGNQHGQVRLGNCFRNGLGVAKDIDTAVLWYHRSADQGWWEAKHELKRLGKYQE